MGDRTRIPVDLRGPAISHNVGNSFWTAKTLTSWSAGDDFDLPMWEFLDTGGTDDAFIYGVVTVPLTIGGTPATGAVIHWTSVSQSAAKVRWEVRWQHIDAAGDLNAAATETVGTATGYAGGNNSGYELNEISIDFGSEPAAGDLILFEIGRINTDTTNDTLAESAFVVAAYLEMDLS